jgi:uncharacterized protein involved in exopolysaccharide biosynthesis
MGKKTNSLEHSLLSSANENPCSSPIYEEDEIDLYQLWLILKKRVKTILITTAIFVATAIAYIIIAAPVYKTEATIFPLGGKKSGVSSLLSSLSISLPIPAHLSSTITVETVLKSRILKERIIKRLNLLPVLFSDLWDKTKTLGGRI